MTKKMEVDVSTSLKYQENGMVEPADEKEVASKYIKIYECVNCGNRIEIGSGSIVFGKDIKCPKCNEIMILL